MRIAYLDCFSGMSGDMFLGALVDAGVSSKLFQDTVAALNIGAQVEFSRVSRSAISATKADVYAHGEKDLPREEYWEQQAKKHADHGHSHEHSHNPEKLGEHNFGRPHHPEHEREREDHAHAESHHHSHAGSRGLSAIREIIAKAPIADSVKRNAISTFEALGAAEAKIHNFDIEKVHFHEVGAVDAMVDIVCAAVGSEALGVDEIICSPLNVGGGMVKCAHGTFPVPAPATLELLTGAPVYSSGIQAELVTPTGAAIVKTLAKRFAPFPAMHVQKIGYGAGTREFSEHANVVRLTVGETENVSGHVGSETITVLEANLDDLTPQVFGYVMDRLFDEGALDAFAVPVQMKKNRPGMLLTVLCAPQHAAKLTQLIFAETTTLGVRRRDETRQALARRWVTVATEWGQVRMKVASMNGTVTNYSPEYEDCRHIAAQKQVPLKIVMHAAVQEYLRSNH